MARKQIPIPSTRRLLNSRATVINAAAGNYAVSGYWQATKPKTDAPDGTIDEPAIEDEFWRLKLSIIALLQAETKISLEVPALKIRQFQNGLIFLSIAWFCSRRTTGLCNWRGEDTYRNAVKGQNCTGWKVVAMVSWWIRLEQRGPLLCQNEEQGDNSSAPSMVLGFFLTSQCKLISAWEIIQDMITLHQEVKKVPLCG